MSKINFNSYGEGKTIVLIHGWSHSSKIWHKIIDDLSKNYNVLTIDLPGHGDSDKTFIKEKENNLLEYLSDSVYEFIKKEKIKPYAIISHSMGGVITLMMLKKYNISIDKLMILGSPYCGLPSSFLSFIGKKVKFTKMMFKSHKKMPKRIRNSFTKLFSRFSVKKFSDVDFSVYDAVDKSSFEFTSRLFKELVNGCVKLDKEFNVKKSFVARGEFDPLSSKKDLKTLAEFLNGEYYEFKNISHTMMLESPKELLDKMNDFL